MSRNSNVRLVKPTLEKLEDRIQPSFLLNGAVQQLAAPLNNIVNDMKSASTDLQAQTTLIKNNTAPANSFPGAEVAYGKAVADWQRILSDSATIQASVNADTAFIHAAAFAELSQGDSTDAVLLTFGTLIGFDPLSALTNAVNQANGIVNDPTLQNLVKADLGSGTFLDTMTPIDQVTVAPTF